jgi:hypothetical protein
MENLSRCLQMVLDAVTIYWICSSWIINFQVLVYVFYDAKRKISAQNINK